MIPPGWTLPSLNQLGGAARPVLKAGPFGSAITKQTYVASGYKVYGQQEVLSGDLNAEKYYISEAAFKRIASCAVLPGDVLITMMGTVGRILEIPDDAEPGVINPRLMRISVDRSRVLPNFLARVLRTEAVQKLLDRRAHGGTMPGLNAAAIGSLTLLLPPLPEQRRIEEVLATWDRAIETVEALIANARAQNKALMQSLLTGKRRLPRFSGQWRHQKISAISNRVNSRNDGTPLPVLTISSTTGFVRQDEKYRRFMAGKSAESYVMLRRGEFAYNKGNSKTYEFGCVLDLERYECALVPHVYVCFKLKSDYSHRFYKALFEADYLASQLGRLVNTGVRNNGLLNITPAQFLGTSVPVPPFAEQEAIAAVMEAASGSVSALKSQLTALRQEKSALMQQLLTGKRRVKLTEREAA